MVFNIFLLAVIILVCFAVFDLIVGVSNDAVNFLNAAIGSKVASRKIIMLVASIGIIAGVTFSSGMMEVARKGIFNPTLFTMPELLALFLGVMITDIMLLDFFSSRGLPTSTTVSVVFELLGSAIAISLIKIISKGASVGELVNYINSTRALMIIGGIFLSIVVSFTVGAIVQFLSRLLFTFDTSRTFSRYGAIWGGGALAAITYFILIKGAKGASFITPDMLNWINTHGMTVILGSFILSAIILQILIFFKVNVFKPIILVGTFALAMAFAANDLVNFIGVPMAGFNAYMVALKSGAMETATMGALAGKVPANTALLLLAGSIMAATLWLSKKSRSVTKTSVSLGQQEEGIEQFNATFTSRQVVGFFARIFDTIAKLTPAPIRSFVHSRFDTENYQTADNKTDRPAFDLLRAAVSLMVASALISYATSHKLPLSTTYVTFMVLMGASLADMAWGRESAVYRVAGVFTVVGGWLLTALIAMTIGGLVATTIILGKGWAVLGLLALVIVVLRNNHAHHKKRSELAKGDEIFNLKKVDDLSQAVSVTFEQVSHLINIIRNSSANATDALFQQNPNRLAVERGKTLRIRQWADIIMANIFKSLRLLQREEKDNRLNYIQVVRRLQKIADGHNDIITRTYEHVANHHKAMLSEQIEELKNITSLLFEIFDETCRHIDAGKPGQNKNVESKITEIKQLSAKYQENQCIRIGGVESKTRLSILYFAILGDSYMLASQCHQLLQIFSDSFEKIAPLENAHSSDKE